MTTEYGITLHRIRALKAIRLENREVRPGELGGWLESEANLSHFGRCWVEKNAAVFGSAYVFEDAVVSGRVLVYEQADIYGNASVLGDCHVHGSGAHALVFHGVRLVAEDLDYLFIAAPDYEKILVHAAHDAVRHIPRQVAAGVIKIHVHRAGGTDLLPRRHCGVALIFGKIIRLQVRAGIIL